jgi:hypothetical protein
MPMLVKPAVEGMKLAYAMFGLPENFSFLKESNFTGGMANAMGSMGSGVKAITSTMGAMAPAAVASAALPLAVNALNKPNEPDPRKRQ